MTTDYKFAGWLGESPESVKGKMVWKEYEPKAWEETNVDIEISHCGMCGSELHTLRSGWAPTTYPCCVGHEIVGKAVRVGSKVEKGIKIGDRVGVGAQSSSCLRPDCEDCSSGKENHCTIGRVDTYNAPYADGYVSKGGYADYWRGPSHFVFKIPDEIKSEDAAPMLCGGITVYSPLKKNGAGPGKKVAIVGIGGLGHFGILYAKALGADKVVGISRGAKKREDALKLGADQYIATNDDPDWASHNAKTVDIIVCTVSSEKMPLDDYLQLLRTGGVFIQVGVPEGNLPPIHAFSLIPKGLKIGGSAIGSPAEIEEMLDLTVKKNVKPWIEARPMKDANQAIVDLEDGKPRYRYVLVNEKHAGK
ncbi:uncharacterized protein KY384_001449 [Bacidia gigantensis]|uniref:uncharacterized protein n=1 Tax=Bacidia gigantensis TaxID=2732470 RepID=UPI001D05C17F|nr:uncharacterized protein KY384_001449 [Bacidia gigantensis]KAG8533708.1 hypothetical protein KY384_001449 [Bacidia gigantensis]